MNDVNCVSAGSNHTGASETWTAHVIWPSGAAAPDEAPMAEIRTTTSVVKRIRMLLMWQPPQPGTCERRPMPRSPLPPSPAVRHPHLAIHHRGGGESEILAMLGVVQCTLGPTVPAPVLVRARNVNDTNGNSIS